MTTVVAHLASVDMSVLEVCSNVHEKPGERKQNKTKQTNKTKTSKDKKSIDISI